MVYSEDRGPPPFVRMKLMNEDILPAERIGTAFFVRTVYAFFVATFLLSLLATLSELFYVGSSVAGTSMIETSIF